MSIGERMKNNYEYRDRHLLTRRTPVIIRVDGRAFHTLTKNFNRPFDDHIIGAMQRVACYLIAEIQGAKLAYVQSDEVSVLLTDWDNLHTEAWFDYNQAKLCSVSASIATVAFNNCLPNTWAQFDARCFNIPESEVANYFLWRAKDWYRNSVTMYAQAHFSHKQLHGKSCSDMHEMLYSIGKNWTTDLTEIQKNGIFVRRDGFQTVKPHFNDIDALVQKVLPCP